MVMYGVAMSAPLPPNFRPDAFAGTAEYYARFRPPYPRALFDHLTARMTIAKADRFLDLAAGTGRVTLPLAPLFHDAIAVDLEPDMVAQGQKLAASTGITNISWKTGAAEDLAFAPGTFRLVTNGDAFHRIDQRLVSRRVHEWLVPGGVFAVIGSRIFFDGETDWEQTVRATVRKWVGTPANERSGAILTHEEGMARGVALLRNVGFVDVDNFDFTAAHTWSAEALIGYHFSTSFASRNALGANADAFAADMRAALGRLGKDAFEHEITFGYTFARKPD
jgi:SAM-dependent methyltransferase